MVATLKQLLAVSVLLSAAEKAVEGRALPQGDGDSMRAAIEHVREAFMTTGHEQQKGGINRTSQTT
jgi:hypothetical protein